MANALILPTFSAGEIAPGLFGRVDTERYHAGAATMRNMFVRYTGGAYSRAGTAFCGYSKQTSRNYPPRLIPFQFSVDQGFVLEFGDRYLRFIKNGGFITENPISITAATKANPCVLTMPATGALTAVPSGTALTSYAPGEKITLAGGVYSAPAILSVNNTRFIRGVVFSGGTGYAPKDTITLTAPSALKNPVLFVFRTQVVNATIAAAGTGGTNGTTIVSGTTGVGTLFQAVVTISGGSINSVDTILEFGEYSQNPADVASEPVTGGGLSGAKLKLSMGCLQFTVEDQGSFSSNPASLTQLSTTGSGTGLVLSNMLFDIDTVSVFAPGAYSVMPTNPVSQASTTGSGTGAQFNLTPGSTSAYKVGDWIAISNVGGMVELNGKTYVVRSVSGNQYTLQDVFGNTIDSTSYGPYTGGGIASRIYSIETPYSEVDLPYLKYVQSADVMSLCCVNQVTGKEYPPYDLSRYADDRWTLTIVQPDNTPAPTLVNAWATPTPANATSSCFYSYSVTAVSNSDGSESMRSLSGLLPNAVDMNVNVGTVTVGWAGVPNTSQYNIYKQLPVHYPAASGAVVGPPPGSLFGYIGSSFGSQFNDSNIIPDFSKGPPMHRYPFAAGQVVAILPVSVGSGYANWAQVTINSKTGSGVVISPVIVSGQVRGYVIDSPGQGYTSEDTVVISGPGTGARSSIILGPKTGIYPGCVSYFQQRRIYASTLNNPDAYWMSQPGMYKNFDVRFPVTDSDAITGAPWALQVNGIQFMVIMPGGLVVLTGSQAWQLTGVGGSSVTPQPITPSAQQAQPQSYNGCSSIIPPIKIDNDIIYVQAKGSIYRDLSYDFYSNIYTGTDLTQSSSHLFSNYSIKSHAWCEEPYKILWSIRDDGVLLCMTFFKSENVFGWSRCDTNGKFVSNCSVTEPPIDAHYLAVERLMGAGSGRFCYTIERMDDRMWTTPEDAWCVDCGLRSVQPTPDATLFISSPVGDGEISKIINLVGGTGYSAKTTATVVDANGLGSGTGAVLDLAIANGVIERIDITSSGQGYTNPAIVFFDPNGAGSGASATPVLKNVANVKTSSAVFGEGSIGSVIRAGGGMLTVESVTSPGEATVDITVPIVDVIPNSANAYFLNGRVRPFAKGEWTLTAPFSSITGAEHLAGMLVTGTADGNILPPFVVPDSGIISLPKPATTVTVGLSYQCQFQTMYLDTGEPTIAGQRKKIAAATVRVEASRDIKVGSNQQDGSFLSPKVIAPVWKNMQNIPNAVPKSFGGLTQPLYTADVRTVVTSGYAKQGQVALQQDNPMPMQILAVVPEFLSGDISQQASISQMQAGRAQNRG